MQKFLLGLVTVTFFYFGLSVLVSAGSAWA